MHQYTIHLPRVPYRDMVKHAMENTSLEVCGLIAGKFRTELEREGRHTEAWVKYYMPITNVSPTPVNHFIMEPGEMIKAWNQILDEKLHVVGCFHTHPYWYGNPSATDLAEANENYFWLIWGGMDDLIRAHYYENEAKRFHFANIHSSPKLTINSYEDLNIKGQTQWQQADTLI